MGFFNRVIKTFNTNKLLIFKVSFSAYNLMMLAALNLFFLPEMSGKLLYKQGFIFLLAGFSRLGSDFYWVSTGKKLIISKKEIPFLLTTSIIISILYTIVTKSFTFYEFFFVLISIILVNSLIFLGRLYQNISQHILSLFTLTVAPTFLTVPLYWFFPDANILLIISISMMSVLILLLIHLHYNKGLIQIEQVDDSVYKRLNFFPMIIYGVLNQNLIQLFSGFFGRLEQSAILLLFQRICSLILWPQIFHMQTELKKIRNSLKDIITFDNYLKNYMKKIMLETPLYLFLVVSIACYFFYSKDNLNSSVFLSFLIILISSLLNLLLGFIQYQIGLAQNGLKSTFVILASLIFSVSYVYFFNSPYTSVALIYFYFHFINHISNLLILRKWLKDDR